MKNKVLIILFMFLILFSFCTSSFCSYDITLNDEVYKFPDEFGKHEYKLFIYSNTFVNDKARLYCYFFSSDTPFSISYYEDDFCLRNTGNYYNYSFSTDRTGSKFDDVYDFSSCVMSIKTSPSNRLIYINNDISFYWSNYDIKDEEGTVVFQGAPLEQVEPMKIRQVEEIQPAMNKVATAILPVILGIVGIFLVIYLMRYRIFSNL